MEGEGQKGFWSDDLEKRGMTGAPRLGRTWLGAGLTMVCLTRGTPLLATLGVETNVLPDLVTKQPLTSVHLNKAFRARTSRPIKDIVAKHRAAQGRLYLELDQRDDGASCSI